ncbi:molecular chaperone DnaK [Pseudomonas sp. Leaf83]|nr:molecular chaperone DnaK [Pseudomonas sp. Leaf83]
MRPGSNFNRQGGSIFYQRQHAESRSQSVELDQSKVGRLSRMDALQQQAMNDAIRSRAQHERVRLQLALKRWHEGEYGWCNQCGELIASGRLEFDPATPLCITCASRAESD